MLALSEHAARDRGRRVTLFHSAPRPHALFAHSFAAIRVLCSYRHTGFARAGWVGPSTRGILATRRIVAIWKLAYR